ncbi:MAG: C10 family peptidase [Bacteroidales bacterium]|nr:C10 family peptidase [Bacteroidales bacterium]
MKRIPFLAILMLAAMNVALARPIDLETARKAGKQFVLTSFNNLRQDPELKWVHTGSSARGEDCFYVFDVDQSGFVIISADDRFRPLVGYSDEGVFETGNPSPELMFYLDKIIEARTSPEAVLPEDAAADWEALLSGKKLRSRNGGRGAHFLVETTWNQDAPYNLYAPEANGGPGGRCYAGCVATAMSQVMKFWDHPATGTGSHGYYSSYGYLSANFGQTSYQWDRMPNRLSNNSSDEEVAAIALLMYHCGVAVNMSYSASGSGAFSDDVPDAIQDYFSYTTHTDRAYRDQYTLHQWQNKLKEQFDLGWPVYYGGYSDTGGHAFVCDGYDDNDLFHYNWGWGGSQDGWFVIDEIDYANWASAVFNFVPAHVYTYMPQTPTAFTVESLGDTEFTAVLSWTNPSQTIHGNNIDVLEKMVLTRNGQVIHTFENVAPGETMTFTDHFLPSVVDYAVYAVSHDARGAEAVSRGVALGPSTAWTVEMSAPDSEGWTGGYISVVDAMGVEVAQLKPNGDSQTVNLTMPLGLVSFYWNAAAQVLDPLRFDIYDADGNRMTGFEGNSQNMKPGLFYQVSNAGTAPTFVSAPRNVRASFRNNDVLIQWESDEVPQAYFVYRDGVLYDLVHENTYLDDQASGAFHHYYVTAFNGVVESDPSETCNIQPSSTFPAPSNLRCEIVNQNRVKILWDAPQTDEEVVYILYRRTKGAPFRSFKTAGSTSYTYNIMVTPWDIYDIAVTAVYDNGESAYASTQLDPEKCYLELNKTLIPLHVGCDVMEEGVTVNWIPAIMADRYALYRNGVLLTDQLVEPTYFDATAVHGQEYRYQVHGINNYLVSNASNTAVVDWASEQVDDLEVEAQVTVSPNPVSNQLQVSAPGLSAVTVYNQMGQQLLHQASASAAMRLDVSSMATGIYFLHVVSDAGVTVVKFVKQ